MKSRTLPAIVAITFITLAFQNCAGFESLSSLGRKTEETSSIPTLEQELPDPGYDIFVIAGQSNSVGYGGGTYLDGNATPERDAKIFQIGRYGANDGKVIPATDRLEHWVSQDANGNPTAGIGMGAAFARLYVKESMKPERKVLIVPAGYGGTSSLHWDREVDVIPAEPNFQDGLMLTDDLVRRLKIALEQPGGTNRFKGLLWHQGESDVDCLEVGIWCNGKTPTGTAYALRIKSILDYIRSQVPYKVPAIAGKLVPGWDGGGRPGAMDRKTEIEVGIASLPLIASPAQVVDTTGLVATSEAGVGSTDTIHFSAQSQIELGGRYFQAFKTLGGNGN